MDWKEASAAFVYATAIKDQAKQLVKLVELASALDLDVSSAGSRQGVIRLLEIEIRKRCAAESGMVEGVMVFSEDDASVFAPVLKINYHGYVILKGLKGAYNPIHLSVVQPE